MASQSDPCFIAKRDVHYPPLKRLASTSTKELVQRLRFSQCDSREKSAMLAMVAGMVNKFAEAQPHSYWREAAMLSSVLTDNQYRHIVTSFANTIIRGTTDGTILDPELLTCFAFVLRYAPLCSAYIICRNPYAWVSPQKSANASKKSPGAK